MWSLVVFIGALFVVVSTAVFGMLAIARRLEILPTNLTPAAQPQRNWANEATDAHVVKQTQTAKVRVSAFPDWHDESWIIDSSLLSGRVIFSGVYEDLVPRARFQKNKTRNISGAFHFEEMRPGNGTIIQQATLVTTFEGFAQRLQFKRDAQRIGSQLEDVEHRGTLKQVTLNLSRSAQSV